jgi:hypothetical protein
VRVHHRAANDRDLAPVRPRQFHRNADAVDGRREAGEEELLLGLREDLVEPRNHGAFAGRVAGTLDVGRVLQQRQHAPLAVLGKGVQVEGLSSSGDRSILKSPVWMTTPTGVSMASATQSTSE